MKISLEKFEELVEEVIDDLPEKYRKNIHNLAFIIKDSPDEYQRRNLRLKSDVALYGLYEGYHQSGRRKVGIVLPDKITIFQNEICNDCVNEAEIRKLVKNTVKHEIAHHFGSDEFGAKKVEK